ncbi:MAG: MBL fold metallo-hydrolase [Alphaproteobacteria bacterium]|nr:MBL fold metallo-hydrolase [Alphaproteobacteria bacterium]
MTMTLQFLGAAGCVTGSCYLLSTNKTKVLIDCGLFQGPKTLKALNYDPFPFKPGDIDAVLLTHAHIDHSGLIPKLFKAGFEREIYATSDTVRLCGVLLPDAGAIQEMEVEAANKRRRRFGDADIEPIFTIEDAGASLLLMRPTPLGEWRAIAPDLRARFWHAGHILGAASIEIEVAQDPDQAPVRILFSGDVGPGGRDLTGDPEGPTDLDHLVLESTYGGVERPPLSQDERRAQLAKAAQAAHAAGGPLLIPAFAVERTQELIVDLIELMEANLAPPGTIFLDSPLAIKACDVFLRHGGPAHANPYAVLRESRLLQFTESANESRHLERISGWHVIIAASGMCDAGRVRHHLKRLLWRPEATVLLVGFQPVGTLGRLLLEGRKTVSIQGEKIQVRADIRYLDIYSGHADGPGLAAWAKARGPVCGKVFLTHGEPDNLKALKKRLIAEGHDSERVAIAELDEVYNLRAGGGEEREAPKTKPRLAAGQPSRLDWHNARASFLAALERQLREAEDDAAREALLTSLSAALAPEPQPAPPPQPQPQRDDRSGS